MYKVTGRPIKVAGVMCYMPNIPLEKHLIRNSHLKKEEQKWQRTELPDIAVKNITIFSGEGYASNEIIDWEAARREEIIGQTGKDPWVLDRHGEPKRITDVIPNPTFVFEQMEDFRKQEIMRCHPIHGGMFCMINGKHIWITPFHYFYMNWWKMNTGYPEWRWLDAQAFYHWQWVYENPSARGQTEAATRGSGKCLSVDENVRLYNGGTIRAGDVEVGDVLVGDDSKKRIVIDSYRGESDMYMIIPNRGEPHKVNKNHILALYYNANRRNVKRGWGAKSYVSLSVEEYLKCNNNEKSHLVLYRRGWGDNFVDVGDVLIPPYMLGMWLGNKHIPLKYLRSSRDNRLELLAGLLDADGYLGLGYFDIVKKNKRLAYQITELARSLGFYVNLRVKEAKMKRKDGTIYVCDVYRASICGHIDEIPTKVKRKQAKKRKQIKNVQHSGFTVVPDFYGEYQGISVTDNKLFLLEDGTVTHNTYRATSRAYQISIYKRNGHIGIQSKTDDDAIQVFQQTLVEPYKDLPDFLVPVNSNPTDPKKELRWFAPAKSGRSAAAMRILQKQALRTKITYRNSKENAYDGATLACLVRDEEGKTQNINVNMRHSITSSSVYRDGKVVGKIISTTTVEEWEKGGESFKKMWDDSDPSELNDIGETKSGLYKIMFPAYQTEHQDEYGYPDEIRAKREQTARRKSLKNNPEALQKYILQYPWNEAEMFTANGVNCQFNLAVLRERERVCNQPHYDGVRIGDFVWTGIYGSPVKWVDNNENGKWEVSMFLDDDKANNVKSVWRDGSDNFVPSNDDYFSAGFDPTKVRSNIRKSRSKAAGVILSKANFWGENDAPDIVASYTELPENPETAYLNFLAGCFYYGCSFLPESNLGISSVLERNNLQEFIMGRPEISQTKYKPNYAEELGMPASEMTNDLILKLSKTWMFHNGMKIKHPTVIKDLISYDPSERGLYDTAVAFQLSVVAGEKWTKPKAKDADLGELFGMWANM